MESKKTNIDDVAICIVTHNHYFETRYFIDHVLANTKGYAKLHVYDYNSVDEGLIDYLKEVCKKEHGNLTLIKNELTLAGIYNKILKEVEAEYIALVPINSVLPENWLIELLYHYKNIENSGCVSIMCDEQDYYLSSVLFRNDQLHEDEMRLVYFSNPNFMDNLMFFAKSRLEKVGYFDENFKHNGHLFNEFSFRFIANGYVNYFIKDVSGISGYIEDSIINPYKTREGNKSLKEEINRMVKHNNFKK